MKRVFILVWGLTLLLAFESAAWAAERVVYGFDREFPPFSYENPGGEATGFEVELLQTVLRGKANLYTRPLSWDQIFLELSAGTITVTSGIIRTDQRARNYGFSAQPTFGMQVRFFTKVYNRQPSNYLMRGQAVAVDQGSYQQQLLEKFGGVNIKPYPPKVGGLRALYNDEVPGYCGLDRTTYYYLHKLEYSGITTMGAPIGLVNIHFAVNRDRGDILRLINDGMKDVIASGEYDRLYRKWFVLDLAEGEREAMLRAARAAAMPAYVPYGKVGVGAAVLTNMGTTYTGCNVENADPQASISALQAAVAQAVGAGDVDIRAVAVVDAGGKVLSLSQTERQLIFEFGRGIQVISQAKDGVYSLPMITELIAEPKVNDNLPKVDIE